MKECMLVPYLLVNQMLDKLLRKHVFLQYEN